MSLAWLCWLKRTFVTTQITAPAIGPSGCGWTRWLDGRSSLSTAALHVNGDIDSQSIFQLKDRYSNSLRL